MSVSKGHSRMARASIIIPAFNSGRFLGEAVQSALDQTAPAHQIVVINDGSTDDTENVLAPFQSRITYLKQENQGVSAARNAGLRQASGEWVVFLDADDRLHPRALEVLLRSSRSENFNQVLYGNVVDTAENRQTIRVRQSPIFAGAPPAAARHLFQFGSIPPSAFAVPLWLVRDVGGFDPRFSYSADVHLWLRCACFVPFVHVPETVLYYRVHGSSMSLKHSALRDTVEAKVDFQKWCRRRMLDILDRQYSVGELVSSELQRFYYRRNWLGVRIALLLAQELDIDNPIVTRIRRLRRLPRWLFTCKDWFDSLPQAAKLRQF